MEEPARHDNQKLICDNIDVLRRVPDSGRNMHRSASPVGFVEGPPLKPLSAVPGPHWHGRSSEIITLSADGSGEFGSPAQRLVVATYERGPNRRANGPSLSWMLSAGSSVGSSAIERTCEHCAHAGHGRPRYADAPGSFSHTRGDGMSALVVDDRLDRIGVDAESSRVADTLDRGFVAEMATADEQAETDASSSFGRSALELWVSKEAVLKMLGIGIVAGLAHVQRVYDPDEAVASVQRFWKDDHCLAIAIPLTSP